MNVHIVAYAVVGLLVLMLLLEVKLGFKDRREQRKLDLKRHIDAICGTRNAQCMDADKRFEECRHICSHYGIRLCEVGFDADLRALASLAVDSMRRYERKQELIVASLMREHKALLGTVPRNADESSEKRRVREALQTASGELNSFSRRIAAFATRYAGLFLCRTGWYGFYCVSMIFPICCRYVQEETI